MTQLGLFCAVMALLLAASVSHAETPTPAPAAASKYPEVIQTVLDNTKPLTHPRGERMQLYLWPVIGGVVDDPAIMEEIVVALNARGIAIPSSWTYGAKDASAASLAQSLRVAKIQQKLGIPVPINANSVAHQFYNGDPTTGHIDSKGKPFFDESHSGAKLGCPFAGEARYAPMTEQVEYFVRGFADAKVPVDIAFADWELDGPLEWNTAWETAKLCKVCREKIPNIDKDFSGWQEACRKKRADITKKCYADPILKEFPKAKVGNYGAYPADNNLRYWWDYFEKPEKDYPYVMDGAARYRRWYDEFPLTGYTLAMPIVYPWDDIATSYDFEPAEYRFFYNMLLNASQAGRSAAPEVPVLPFVHFNVIRVHPETPPPTPLSAKMYQELLWHALMRGNDSFFMWCETKEVPDETRLLQEIYAASLEYADWLNRGTPVTFFTPKTPAPVVSGLRIDDRVLVRRTDFSAETKDPVDLEIEGRIVKVPRADGKMQILAIPKESKKP